MGVLSNHSSVIHCHNIVAGHRATYTQPMNTHRFILYICMLSLVFITRDIQAQTHKLQDAVGLIEFADPGISDEPNAPTEQWIDPLITKQLRFQAPGSAAVLISTRIRPDLPADDSRLDDIQAKYERLMETAEKESFVMRRFQAASDDVVELVMLNANYSDTFPLGISIDHSTPGLQTLGISQMIVREGRLIELAFHLKIKEGEDQGTLISRARSVCNTWRESVKAHPAEPWEPPLPDATEGYTWWLCPQTRTALRKPEGWHTKATVRQGSFGYFIPKEDIEEKGEYLTGLMVNVTPQAERRYNTAIIQIAGLTIRSASGAGEVLEGPWRTDSELFIAFGIVVKHKDAEKGDYVTHHLAIGNTETGTLYNTVFEAPADEWEQAWKLGEPIIKLLILSPDI